MKKFFVLCVLVVSFIGCVWALGPISEESGQRFPEGLQTEHYQLAEEAPMDNFDQSRALEDWSGQGPWGGMVRSFAVSPFDSSFVLATCGFSMANKTGSVWKSTDGGINWSNAGLSGKPFYGVAASYLEEGVFYAGGRNGFYKTEDFGTTWTLVSMENTFILKIGTARNDTSVVVAGVSSNNGIRVSNDGGINWNECGINTGYLKDIETTPDNPNKIFIAGNDFGGGTIYVTTDGGSGWQDISPTPVGADTTGYALWVSPEDENFLLLLHGDGLYKTTDGGSNWSLVLADGGGQGDIVSHGENLYCSIWGRGLFESSDNGDTWNLNPNVGIEDNWHAGTSTSAGVLMGFWGGIYRGEGLGNEWPLSATGMNAAFIHSLAYYEDRNELWAGTQGSGLFLSTDGGQTWERKVNGLNSLWIYDIAPTDHHDFSVGRMLISTQSGIYVSDDYGETWVLKDLEGTTVTDAEIHWTDPDQYWICGAMGPIKYTNDNGETWTEGAGLPFGLYPKIALAKNSQNQQRVLVCYENGYGTSVYYSDDNGANFVAGAGIVGVSYHPQMSVHLADLPGNQKIYCATEQGIFKSVDCGENWALMDGISGLFWSLNATRNDDIFGGAGSGVYHSPNNGTSWQAVNEGIETVTVWRVLYGLTDDQIFIATQGEGVKEYHFNELYAAPINLNIELTENGALFSWEPPIVADQLVGYKIYLNDAFVEQTTETSYQFNDASGSNLIAGVSALYEGDHESSIQEIHFSIVAAENAACCLTASSQLHNYPNPFNPETTIGYAIPQAGQVSLAIYNVKGQLVKQLVSNFKQAGEHSVLWNGTNEAEETVASGLYFYRLTTQNQTITKKMLLMK